MGRRVIVMIAVLSSIAGVGCGRALERVAPNWFPDPGPATASAASASASASSAAGDQPGDPSANVGDSGKLADPGRPGEPGSAGGIQSGIASDEVDADAVAGFVVEDVVVGTGPKVTATSFVRLTFVAEIVGGDTLQRQDEPTEPWPVDALVPGLSRGLAGMAPGGRRVITIPPELAYGGVPILGDDGTERIPADSTLQYDVTLVELVDRSGGATAP